LKIKNLRKALVSIAVMVLVLNFGIKILDKIIWDMILEKYAKKLKIKYEELELSNRWNQ
jgi:hypothetical protein